LNGFWRDFWAYGDENKQFEAKLPDTLPGYGWIIFLFLYLISARAPIGMGFGSGRGGDGMRSA
jgi:hypothetical protein